MRIRRAFFTVCAAASLSWAVGLAHATDAMVPVSPPPEVHMVSAQVVVPVIYSESQGEVMNSFDRAGVEAVCFAARSTGLTTKKPTFESGFDKPLKTQDWRFSTETRTAHYSLTHEYGCATAASAADSTDAVCGCNYRTKSQYRAHIVNRSGGRVEIIEVDFADNTATRRSMSDRKDASDPERLTRALAPEVIGQDVVAGIPCVIRRQKIDEEKHIDRCIADDAGVHLPPWAKFQTLSERFSGKDQKDFAYWTRTDRVVLNARADIGVFALPSGVKVKELK